MIETARITDYVATDEDGRTRTESRERYLSLSSMGRFGWQAVKKLTTEADAQRNSTRYSWHTIETGIYLFFRRYIINVIRLNFVVIFQVLG